jgi:hypothetical protein
VGSGALAATGRSVGSEVAQVVHGLAALLLKDAARGAATTPTAEEEDTDEAKAPVEIRAAAIVLTVGGTGAALRQELPQYRLAAALPPPAREGGGASHPLVRVLYALDFHSSGGVSGGVGGAPAAGRQLWQQLDDIDVPPQLEQLFADAPPELLAPVTVQASAHRAPPSP